jgi:hypothetical protein
MFLWFVWPPLLGLIAVFLAFGGFSPPIPDMASSIEPFPVQRGFFKNLSLSLHTGSVGPVAAVREDETAEAEQKDPTPIMFGTTYLPSSTLFFFEAPEKFKYL